MTKEEAIRILSTRDSHGMITGYAGGVKEAIDMGLQALEQQPCEDCISRQTVIDSIRYYFHDEYYQRTSIQDCRDCLIEDVIKSLPSATPIRPKGEWETGYTYPDGEYWKCSECGELIKVKFPMNFCNSCGADMRGEKE